MGDLANMTSPHGDVNGRRLLKWLRSHEEMEEGYARAAHDLGDEFRYGVAAGRASLLSAMADDLERDLTPPGQDVCPKCGGEWKLDHRAKTVCRSCGHCVEDSEDGIDLDTLPAPDAVFRCQYCGGVFGPDGHGGARCNGCGRSDGSLDGIDPDTLPAPGRVADNSQRG